MKIKLYTLFLLSFGGKYCFSIGTVLPVKFAYEFVQKRRRTIPDAIPCNKHLRMTSEPYISGDSFRSLADGIFDETSEPEDIEKFASLNPGDIVFTTGDFIDFFFEHIHPYIPVPYVLLTHNSDASFPGKHVDYLSDEKIIHWCSHNPSIKNHPKFTPIPIGIPNRHWYVGKEQVIKKLESEAVPLKYFAYMNLSDTHQERLFVKQLFAGQPYVYNSERKGVEQYLLDLKQSKFCFSPRGNGLDCHRTWEALLMGCIPIVRSSFLDPIFEGLPVLIDTKWDNLSFQYLSDFYNNIFRKKYDLKRLYFQYWKDLILQKSNKLLVLPYTKCPW